MAKNRELVKPVESEYGEEEEDDASSEEIGHHESHPPSKPQQQNQKQPSSSSDEEESGSGSGSESDSDSDSESYSIKPLAFKTMEYPSNNGGLRSSSKHNSSDVTTPAKITSVKRPAEDNETDKRSKKKPAIESSEKKSNDDSKKLLFQRLWSEDDEIVILEGMIDYTRNKKSDPVSDLNAFHEFIKKNLHVDVTKTQLQDKIRRLKKKYVNNKSKEKEGKDKTCSKPHEQKAYEISKKIWGNDNTKENLGETSSAVRKTPVKRTEVTDNKEASVKAVRNDGNGSMPAARVHGFGSDVDERTVGIGLEGEQEWKKLAIEEIEVYLMQLEMNRAGAKLVLDTLKSYS